MTDSRTSKVFDKVVSAWASTDRFVSSCGGTRSGKTFSALQLLIYLADNDKTPTITSVVSETMPHLKRGAIRDFQTILGDTFKESAWNKTDCVYKFPNGSIIEFFSADSPSKVHGPARDRLFINEAQNISHEIARQLFVRSRGKILIDYNPTHSFWLNERIEVQDNCKVVHSTYIDNCDSETGESFLTREQIAEIESNRNDSNWWRVYGEGKVGVLEGIIYDFEQIDELPDNSSGHYVETYGLDFGFTQDPSVLVHTLIDTGRKEVFFDEVFYEKGLLNSDIIQRMTGQGIGRNTMVFADCAEPKTIEEICRAGYNCLPCYKATRKAEQVQMLRGYKHHITKRSINAIREHRGYVWAQDKDGHNLNEPIAFNDHFEDAARYSVISYLTEYAGSGVYSFGFSRR